MLKSLRTKLTLVFVIITGILLSVTAAAILFLSENQMDRQSEVTFQNNLNSIIYKLQSSHVIDNLWLSQLETGNHLIVEIQDNGKPILFRGSWTPKTDRSKLLETTRQRALDTYGFDSSSRPQSVISVDHVTFSLTGDQGDRYQAAVAKVPSDGKDWQSITLLRDVSVDQSQKNIMRLSFVVLIALALTLLFLFSWWFSGRTIAPIEESRQKQVEFVAAASHELRSPLAVIQASVSALSDSVPEQQRFIDTSIRECRRMAGLIDDLLFLASSDAGTWSVHTEQIEPDTLMTEVYESFLPVAQRNGQQISLQLPSDAVPEISGDRKRLFQALSVLVDNALSYTPENGSIHLTLRQEKRSFLLVVEDNGPGVPEEQKSRIFERFYRGDPSRSKKEHYGLGLAVAREIAELHGGKLTVADGPEGGAAFTIQLFF